MVEVCSMLHSESADKGGARGSSHAPVEVLIFSGDGVPGLSEAIDCPQRGL